jgi:hypothetical protein
MQAEIFCGKFLHFYQITLRHVEEELVWILTLVETSGINQFCFKFADNHQDFCILSVA